MQIRLKGSSRFTCFDGSESEKAETRVEKRVHSSDREALSSEGAASTSGAREELRTVMVPQPGCLFKTAESQAPLKTN